MQLDALFKQTKLLCEGCESDDREQARHAWNLANDSVYLNMYMNMFIWVFNFLVRMCNGALVQNNILQFHYSWL